MTLLYMQGFEQVKPTTVGEVHILPNEVREFLGFQAPANTVNWFRDVTGSTSNDAGPLITDADSYINGQCLIIKRPDAGDFNFHYNGKSLLDLSVSIPSNTITNTGFAVKYSKAPSIPIPLLQSVADLGLGGQEQTSLWVGALGQLFFSSTPVSIATTGIQTPTPITGTLTAVGTINFDRWNYVEVRLNYANPTPTATVYVNGVLVISAFGSADLQGANTPLTTKVSIINPSNIYFPDNSYDMLLDDMYFTDGAGSLHNNVLGPQHIILLTPDFTEQNEFLINGGLVTSDLVVTGPFDKSDTTNYLTNDDPGDEEIFTLTDLPINVNSVTACMLAQFANVDAGTATFTIGQIQGANIQNFSGSMDALTPEMRYVVLPTNASGGAWTIPIVNDTKIKYVAA